MSLVLPSKQKKNTLGGGVAGQDAERDRDIHSALSLVVEFFRIEGFRVSSLVFLGSGLRAWFTAPIKFRV